MAAARSMEMCLVAILVTTLWAGAINAQLSCTPATVSLSPCLSFINGNSSTPSSLCCSQLASIVSTQAQCLCAVFNGNSSSLGFNFNQTQALILTGACNIQTPPVGQCNATAGPVTSPAEAPTSLPTPPMAALPATPSTPSIPSNKPPASTIPSPTQPSMPAAQPSTPSVPRNGSKTAPSASRTSSDATTTTIPLSLFIVLLVASYASYVAVL